MCDCEIFHKVRIVLFIAVICNRKIFQYYRFPSDKQRSDRWTVRLRRQGELTGSLWKPGNRAVVCSEHFLPSDFFWQWGRKLIKPDAEPTIFSFGKAVKRRKAPADRSFLTPANEEVVILGNSSIEMDTLPEVYVTTGATAQVTASITMPDHKYCIEQSPRKLSGTVRSLVQRLHDRTATMRNAQRRECRLRGKVADLLKRMKGLQLLTSKAEDLLEVYRDMPLNLLSGKIGRQFSNEQKQFALTLHYYSPAAYQFVRRRFRLLPCLRTLRSWLSSFDGSPGLTMQSFDTIAAKNKNCNTTQSLYKLCALHVDEMEIKKQLDFDRTCGKVYGFTDIGSG